MSTTFRVDYDLNELRKRLNSIIDVENQDNVKTHLRQTLLFKDESLVSGMILNDPALARNLVPCAKGKLD